MRRLTEKEYWDAQYSTGRPAAGRTAAPGPGLSAAINRLLGPRVGEYTRHYPDYLLWDVLYANNLPRAEGARVLEVGSAPGDHLLQLRRVFAYEAYGVEYSEQGVQVNRELFRQEGLDPANVIHGDFLSSEFQSAYRGYFDIVISRGFVEHFADVEPVITGHLNVLRNGGHLVVTVPNLRGINLVLARFFHKESLPLHNLAIMRREVFCNLFTEKRLSPLTCRYYGTFHFGIFNTKPDSPKRHILRLCTRMQHIMNVLFRIAFAARGAESEYLSPYLIFIGIKKR